MDYLLRQTGNGRRAVSRWRPVRSGAGELAGDEPETEEATVPIATTLATGEEDPTTLGLGEEEFVTTAAVGEEGPTLRLGEDWVTTEAVGEEGPTTLPLGEEFVTTEAVGEEGPPTGIAGEAAGAQSGAPINPFGAF
jgi:hypothetical protein